tara:strand:- start:6160 stop:8871 length:2712 start_codon:yes stop_codon:yes gene_type:complete
MSVQLIVFPQYFDGTTPLSPLTQQMVVDGINFNNIPNSSSTLNITGALPQTFIDTYATASSSTFTDNTWYRFSSTGSQMQRTFSGTSNIYYLIFANGQGVLQQLSNLITGALYEFTLDITTNGGLTVYQYTNNILQSTNVVAGTGVQTIQFTAQSTNDIIVIQASGSSLIETLSCLISPQNPSEIINIINNGQVILDLYEDEDIPLSLSVDEFKNVAEQIQSYSKAFNLPATKRNNQIFDNIFEVTRIDTGLNFNPYKKTKCILKQDGFLLFEGFLRLIDISDKSGEISYNVNLYSEAIALADVLGDRTFNDIDFYELNHDYNFTTIRLSWNESGGASTYFPFTHDEDSGFRSYHTTIKYPFCDWTHNMLTNRTLSQLEDAFRPFIQIKYLINRIFANTDFTYTSSFFDSADFEKLYMDFNWGNNPDGSVPFLTSNFKQADDTSSDYFINESSYTAASKLRFNTTLSGVADYWDNTNFKFTAPSNNYDVTCEYDIKLESDAIVSTYSNNLRIAKFNSSGQWLQTFDEDNSSIAAGGSKFMSGTFTTTLQSGEYIQAQSYALTPNKIRMGNDTPASFLQFFSSTNEVQAYVLLNKLRGDLGQWEFIRGIMTMFNLITIPDENNPNNIIIEPYNDIFLENADTKELNWTEKIDVTEMKLLPLTELNRKTSFKFVEDEDDYIFSQYKKSVVQPATGTGFLYGSHIIDASDFTILTGEKEIIAEPFAATIPKPYDEYDTELIVPTLYKMNDDGTTEAFENSPRIMFNIGQKTLAVDLYNVPAQNGVSAVNDVDGFLQFSHLTDTPTVTSSPPATTDTQDFHFGLCQLIDPVGNPTLNNLYGMYWEPYFNELYNPDTRTMTIKVNLTPSDINTFNFFDTVMIKNRKYRVNRIDYKPNDLATVEFILIP